MKRPSFQFYSGDWLSDPALRICSLGARGLWADMMCMMHDGSLYGYLKVGHKVILPANLERLGPVNLDDLAIVETRYAAQWPPNGENYLRTSILTFLHNFPGEVDRARSFALARKRGSQDGQGCAEAPRGEFARPFDPAPQKPQHVIDRENAARATQEPTPHLIAA